MPRSSLGDRLPEDWILGNQIGILAWALMQFAPGVMTKYQRTRLTDDLLTKLNHAQAEFPPDTFPVATLHLLSRPELRNGLSRHVRDALTQYEQAFSRVTRGRTEADGIPRPSRANAAKLIAHQILYSDASAKAVVGALSAYVSPGFESLQEAQADLATLKQTTTALRQRNFNTAQHVSAVARLTEVLSRHSTLALPIRNALLDSLLAWPIVVFGENPSQSVGATAVPVAVDIAFDGKGKVSFESFAHAGSGSDITEGWAMYLRRAAEIGKTLWRSKNGNAGTLRERVMDASVAFNFTVIEKIFGGLPLRAQFADNSMEAYFAQIVLAKASGRNSSVGAAVSGWIGEQRTVLISTSEAEGQPISPGEEVREPNGEYAELQFPEILENDLSEKLEERPILDWNFEWPAGIRQKKHFVYSSYKYSRLVLPRTSMSIEDDHGSHDFYVETNNCRSISDVADCVQTGGWRQFRYIRCPDIMHTMHRYSKELPAADAEAVLKCLAMLEAAEGPVLRLPESVGVAGLFGALHHLNSVQRLQAPFPAPSLSWSVVRSAPGESSLHFWHLVLRRAIGAASGFEDDLLMSSDPDEAAGLLARALDLAAGSPTVRAERPPDLLILIGCKHHSVQVVDEITKVMQPLSFAPVVDALSSKSIRSIITSETMAAALGRTRVILLDADESIGLEAPQEPIDQREAEMLARLLVFRNGFNLQMANSILRNMYDGSQDSSEKALRATPLRVRSDLQALISRGFITNGGGWYRIRKLKEGHQAYLSRRSDLALANAHFYAGLGFAPYLLKWTVPGLNIAEAMLSDHVREAIFHFEQAASYANHHLATNPEDQAVTGIRKQSRLAQERLMRFFDVPSWSVVSHLSRNRKEMPHYEAYTLGKDLLEKWKDAGRQPQPRAWSITADAGERFWNEKRRILENKRQEKDTAYVDRNAGPIKSLFIEVEDLYERGLHAANEYPVCKKEFQLNISTHYSAFLHLYGNSEREFVERRSQLDAEIWALLQQGVTPHGLEGRWFECVGDRCEDHSMAADIYYRGCILVPKWMPLWAKALGAAYLGNANPNEIMEQLIRSSGVDLAGLHGWNEKQQIRRVNRLRISAVNSRWHQGKRIVSETLSSAKNSYTRHASRT